jgi:peptidoglycan/LPS O-acetylase OafA/YrhL
MIFSLIFLKSLGRTTGMWVFAILGFVIAILATWLVEKPVRKLATHWKQNVAYLSESAGSLKVFNPNVKLNLGNS